MLHEEYMKEALQEARKAMKNGEVPVGAVVVLNGEIIGRGHNRRESAHDPTAHAEILALREAGKKLNSWRLNGAVLYVTLEPCPMCAGAVLQSRIDRVVYGADDPKAGSAGTLLNILQFPGFNHQVKITGGVLAGEAAALLREFFERQRDKY
ncbi:MAG: tRNA adenosine(34) deaminase TadA [Peptococcaceae bacterium]|jgi:tRNA(adenine34) deaminase|nr:tRNA adenosine(34) deaminase TadA [Peptococcaceae bacterium]MDH7523836.1 tRNA adenosine(34) deaminase TadA [Peptococcaceae bacterium]